MKASHQRQLGLTRPALALVVAVGRQGVQQHPLARRDGNGQLANGQDNITGDVRHVTLPQSPEDWLEHPPRR